MRIVGLDLDLEGGGVVAREPRQLRHSDWPRPSKNVSLKCAHWCVNLDTGPYSFMHMQCAHLKTSLCGISCGG